MKRTAQQIEDKEKKLCEVLGPILLQKPVDIKSLLEELYALVEELPVDWVGTGSYQAGEKEEKNWNKKYKALKEKLILCSQRN